MPDYPNNILPDKKYLQKIICTLFPEELYDIVQEGYNKRSVAEITPNDEMTVEIDIK